MQTEQYQHIKVVQLLPADWRRYKKIRLRALKEDPLAFGSSYEEVAAQADDYWINRLKEAQETGKKWLVFAESDTELIGMMTANLHEGGIVQVHAVFVVPEARGYGVASTLMKYLLEIVKNNPDAQKACLDVNKQQAAAIGLYQKFGFKIVDEAQEPLGDGNNHPVYIMHKQL